MNLLHSLQDSSHQTHRSSIVLSLDLTRTLNLPDPSRGEAAASKTSFKPINPRPNTSERGAKRKLQDFGGAEDVCPQFRAVSLGANSVPEVNIHPMTSGTSAEHSEAFNARQMKAIEGIDLEIPPEMESIVSSALQKYDVNENKEMCEFNGVKISRKMMITLNEGVWLMDEVINFFFQLLVERSKLDNYPSVHAMTTFFYPALQKNLITTLRWTRKVDIFSYDLILIPLHLTMHWALVVVDNRTKCIKYFDSMWSGSENCLFTIQNYLVAEMKSKKNIDMDPNEYSLERVKDIPQQMNGSDCGMFTIRYAEYLSRDAPITFKQAHMSYFRRRTAYEILTKKLF